MSAFKSGAFGGGGGGGGAGADGAQGPAGRDAMASPQSAWVYEAGVEGVDTPFNAANWQDATTAGAAAGCVVATVGTLGDALLVTAGSTGSSAINRPLVLADGDDICARVVVNYGQNILAGLTAQFQLATFDVAGAATNWSGVGINSSNNNFFSGPVGAFHNTAGNINSITSGSVVSNASPLAGTADIRIRRSGASLLKYISIGGAWHLMGPAVATGFTAGAGNMAGFRMQVGAGQSLSVRVLAWKHFVGGLPAAYQ